MNKKYFKKANAIIQKMVDKANDGGIRENFGDNELRKFNDLINNDDSLGYAEKADLSSYLSEKLSRISQDKQGYYFSN